MKRFYIFSARLGRGACRSFPGRLAGAVHGLRPIPLPNGCLFGALRWSKRLRR